MPGGDEFYTRSPHLEGVKVFGSQKRKLDTPIFIYYFLGSSLLLIIYLSIISQFSYHFSTSRFPNLMRAFHFKAFLFNLGPIHYTEIGHNFYYF
jgi:hypothetical protein